MGFIGKIRVARLERALVLLVTLTSTAVLAQGSAVLTGTISDAATKKNIPDVVVTATSPALQGEQIVVTDATGQFRIPQLPPGTYNLRLEKEAYKPFSRGEITIRADRTVRVNFDLLPETLNSEEIEVVGRAPTIDVGSTNTGVSVGADFVRNIAVVRPGGKGGAARSFESLAEVAPGANADAYGVSVNGTTSPENQFIIDGLSVNDAATGILGTPLTIDFIQEVNVITGGYMPEFGRATGGIMNVVTKSGSNEFHGSVFGNYSPGSLNGSTPLVKREGTVVSTTTKPYNLGDFGAEVGGPIIKDKLWFFAGIAPSFNRLQVSRNLNRILYPTDSTTHLPDTSGDPLKDSNGFTQTEAIAGTNTRYFADSQSIQYIAKLTYLLNQNHNVTLSFYGSPYTSGGLGKFGIDPTNSQVEGSNTFNMTGNTQSQATIYRNNATDLSLKWASSFLDKRVLLDITAGRHAQSIAVLPSDGTTVADVAAGKGFAGLRGVTFRRTKRHSIADFEELPPDSGCEAAGTASAKICPVTAYRIGGPGFINEATMERYQAKAVGTYLLSGLGHHIFKAGIDVEAISYLNNKAYTGTDFLREGSSGGSFTDYRQFGYLAGPDEVVIQANQQAKSTSSTLGGFIQDSWTIADKVVLNAGVRYDTQTLVGNDNKVGLILGNEISPRVGLIYDFTQQGRSKIFANYARFYESVPLDLVDRQFPGERQVTHVRARAPKGGGKGCDPLADYSQLSNPDYCLNEGQYRTLGGATDPSQVTTITGGDKSPVDPKLQPQSTDEIVVGGEYEVVPDGRVGVQYTKRYMNNVIEDMSRDEANTYFIGNPGSGIASDFPKATRDYDAATVYFNKTFSDLWLAQASYTYATLRGNYAGLFRPETEQLDPNINSDFDLISLLPNRTGPLPGDVTHSIKVFGAREIVLTGSNSINIGVSYRARSGAPINYLGSHEIYGPDEVFVLPRGSGGRLPWVHNFDTHLGYTHKLSKDNAITVYVDVFNLLNFAAATSVDQRFTSTNVMPYQTVGDKSPQQAICGVGTDVQNCQLAVKHPDGTALDSSEINPNFKNVNGYQAPQSFRFGAKFTF